MKDPKAIRKAIMTAKSIASLIDPKFARVPLPDIGLPAPDMVVPEHSTTVHSAYDVPMPQKYAAGGDVEGRDLNQFGLYSHASEQAGDLARQDSPENYRNMLLKRGVKPAELEWSGFNDAFANQPQITRDQVVEHFQGNMPDLYETQYGGNEKGGESLSAMNERHGQENREHALNRGLAEMHGRPYEGESYRDMSDRHFEERASLKNHPFHEDYTVPGGKNYREVLVQHNSFGGFEGVPGHFGGAPDIISSLRLKDREDHEGDKVLHLEELQSDWGQQGRQKGFEAPKSEREVYTIRYPDGSTEYNVVGEDEARRAAEAEGGAYELSFVKPATGVKKAAYVTKTDDWVDLGLKRALLEAAKGGYDKLAWSPGDVHADRYDLSKHIGEIRHEKNDDGTYNLDVFGKDGSRVFDRDDMSKDDLADHVGKEMAEKIIAGHGEKDEDPGYRDWRTISGLDLKVGGEGMRKFYDEMLPKRLMKLAKQHEPETKLETSHTKGDEWPYSIAIGGNEGDYHIYGHDPRPHARGDGSLSGILERGFKTYGEADDARQRFLDGYHTSLPAIKITPRMRESILKKGFAAYAAGGEVEFPDYASTSGDGIDREGNRSAFLEGNHPLVPDVVYHGTDRDISQFDTEQPRRVDAGMDAYNTDTGWYGKGHYFTPHKRAASGFASDYRVGEGGGPNVMPVHLSLKNPFIVKVPQNSSGATDMDRAMDEAGFPKTSDERLLSKGRGERRPSEQTQMLMERGHDGVIVMQQFGFKDRDEEKAAEARKEAAWKRHLAAQDAYYEAPFENAHNGAEIKSIKDEFIKTRREYHAAKEAAGGEYKPHELVVFKPHQVKSAIGNSGQYDPSEADITKAAGGDVEGYASGGDIDPEKFREHLKRIYSPLSEDPEIVRKALQIAGSYRAPIGMETGVGSLYTVKQSMPASAVTRTIQDIPGINLKPKVKGSWEDFYDLAKGNEFVNVGGDLSGFGRLTHINGKELAWPVDLHAGADYMREPNPGRVWANIGAHATGFQTKIREANERGKELYGILSPMGPSAVNSSHNMFDTLMAQIPNAEIDSEHIKEFDDAIKRGDHLNPKIKRNPKLFASYLKKLEKWPGLEDAKEVSEFARPWRGNLTGAHRADIVKFMDKGYWRDRGFPEVGVTRAAITNPDLMGAGGNKLGYRAVKLSAEPTKDDKSIFKHSTYPVDTFGEYVMDVPLVQRHYAQPDVIERLIKSPTKAGQIVHPYSEDPMGRSTARKLFEEQKQLQPVNQRFLDSVMTGMENQEKYGFKAGGSVRKALMIAKGVKKK